MLQMQKARSRYEPMPVRCRSYCLISSLLPEQSCSLFVRWLRPTRYLFFPLHALVQWKISVFRHLLQEHISTFFFPKFNQIIANIPDLSRKKVSPFIFTNKFPSYETYVKSKKAKKAIAFSVNPVSRIMYLRLYHT